MTKRKPKERLQKEQFAELFARIKPDVAAEDIKQAEDRKIASQATISRYLNGDVADTGVAYKLATHFQKCINKRQQALS